MNSTSDLSATQNLKPIVGLNLTQGLTDPMSGSSAGAGGIAPRPTSPVDIAKQNQATGGMLSQQVGAMDQQAQQFDQQQSMQAEQFKQEQATQMAEQQAQQAEQARKANEEALKNTTKSVEDAQKMVVQTQLGSLKATGQQFSGLSKKMQGLRTRLSKNMGALAQIKMAGSVPVATGPSRLTGASLQPAKGLEGASLQPATSSASNITARPQPGGGGSAVPVSTIGTPNKSQQAIEGSNHSTYEAQSAGLRQPGGATYNTPAGGMVSTVASGRPRGIYSNGVLMVKDQTGRYVPASQAAAPAVPQPAPTAPQPAPAPQPAAPAAPQPAPATVAQPATPAPQPTVPQGPVLPDRPGTHRRALEPSPVAAPQDHYRMAQQAAGGAPVTPPPAGTQTVTPEQNPALMGYLKEKTNPLRNPEVHSGVDDALLTSQDPAQAQWAQNTLAQNYIKQHGAGTYNEAADYFSKAFGDPARGQELAGRVFDLSNEQIKQQQQASKMEDYGANAPWYRPDKKIYGMGQSLFDNVTGADQVAMDDALFQRPDHFGTAKTLTEDQRKQNMSSQLGRMSDKQELDNGWLNRHQMGQDDESTFNKDFISNMTGWVPTKDDSWPTYFGKNFMNNGSRALGGLIGNVADGGQALRQGRPLKALGQSVGGAVDAMTLSPWGLAINPAFKDKPMSMMQDDGTAPSPYTPVYDGQNLQQQLQAPAGGSQIAPDMASYLQQNPEQLEAMLPQLMESFGGKQRTY